MSNQTVRSKIHPLSILAAVFLAAALLGLVYLLLRLAGVREVQPEENPTAVLTIIAAPTHTPVVTVPTPASTPTSDNVVILPPNTMGVGAYVKVGRTEGVGLRMRSEPGTGTEVRFVAMDDEVFLVVGGPVESDGYTWWQLKAPYDETRTGWSAEDFLDLVELNTPTP